MYGLIIECVQHSIQKEFGEDKWAAILDNAGVPNTIFQTHTVYPDELVMKLANAAATVLGEQCSKESFLTYFGRSFVRSSCIYGYDKIMKVCGRFFCDFLTAIDSIHLQMMKTYPNMENPFMYVADEDVNGVLLHYRTSRQGYCPYLKGILIQIANDFYDLQLSVEELPQIKVASSFAEDGYQYRFRLNFDNRNYMADQQASRASCINLENASLSGAEGALEPLSSSLLMKLFPFTLVFRKDLQIIATGTQLKEMYAKGVLVGQSLPAVARMCRPKLCLTWENLFSLQQVSCELELLPTRYKEVRRNPFSKDPFEAAENENVAKKVECTHLLLRGKIRYFEEWEALLFICHPLLHSMEDLEDLGLNFDALSLHGHGRDLIMTGWQHNSKLKELYERAKERSQDLEKTYDLQGEWKKRGDALLYSMIPRSVADSLRSGCDTVDTCQTFESVTVLFVELANIDDITDTNAMQAVGCVNSVFTCFDNVIDNFNVYKVETVGKVYMVVGGAPEENETHPKDIALVALSFRDEIEKLAAAINLPIQIRIGFHTGPAVAGIVGLKIPRYCFFGDTINTAARMQTTSSAGKIHTSQGSYDRLQLFHRFVFEPRGTVSVKGKGYMQTYWLLDQQPQT